MKQKHLRQAVATLCVAMATILAYADSPSGIYGYATSDPCGVYDILNDGFELKWQDDGYKSRWYVPMTSGWVDGDKFCGYATDIYSSGTIADNFYVEYDWDTGAILSSSSVSGSTGMKYAVRNPVDNMIYGYGFSEKKWCFLKASADSPSVIQVVCEVEKADVCSGLAFNSTEGYIAGINSSGELYRIETDGSRQLLMSTDKAVEEFTPCGLAWSATEGVFYWNWRDSAYKSYMYKLDPERNVEEILPDFPSKQMSFLFDIPATPSADTPAAPEIISADFGQGNPSGNFVIKMPSLYTAGDPITGELIWEASVDGSVAGTGASTPGSEVSVSFGPLETGAHSFRFVVVSGEKRSPAADRQMWIGIDTPAAPANVTLSTTEVRWEAVTTGAHQGYIDASAVSYTIYLNGEQIGTTGETAFTLPSDENPELRLIQASVTATAGGITSEPALSNKIAVGDALIPPVLIAPTPDDIDLCATIDGNKDGRVWTYDDNEKAFASGYNDDISLDDWLILPPMKLDADKTYYFSAETRRRRNSFKDEYLEICIGNAPSADAMTTVLVEKMTPEYAWSELRETLRIPSDGDWYIGFHCTSDAWQSGIFVKNISVSDNGVRDESPAAVSALKAEAAENGVLKATVTFTMPETTVGDAAIDEGTELTAKVQGASSAQASGLPGQEVSVEVATVQGLNKITVEPFIGDIPGPEATVEVYTGVEIPSQVGNVTVAISDDMTSAVVTWSAPADGEQGGYIVPENLTYSVYLLTESMLGDVWEKLADGLTECTYTFQAPKSEQDAYEIGIAASNIAGENPEPMSEVMVLGTPHTLPMADDFDSKQIYTFNPWVIYMPTSEYDTYWTALPLQVFSFIPENEGNALIGNGFSEYCLGKAGFPVFSTSGITGNIRFAADFWTGENATPDIRITATASGLDAPEELCTVESNDAWNHIEFNLPESLCDRKWVNLFLETSFPEAPGQWLIMDNYSISQSNTVAAVGKETASVKAVAGEIVISAPSGTDYTVSNVNGAILAAGKVSSDTARTRVAPGIYIVKVGDNVKKLIMR